MYVLRNFWSWMRTQLGAAGRSTRLWAALAATLVLGGAVWLLYTSGREDMVAATDVHLTDGNLSAAVDALQSRGVACQIKAGRLLVDKRAAVRARKILTDQGLADGEHTLAGRFDVADDIWITQAQSDKRWQAAKMAALSRLISDFTPVRRAVVIFEPGRRDKLSGRGTKPTAAVNVSLADSTEMSGRLVEAIADMVAGSVAGLDRADVCVIDSRGRSYRVGDESLAEQRALARRERFERCYERKIAGALAYIRGLTVVVRLGQDNQGSCAAVTLAVPRSYFDAVAAADRRGAGADIVASESARIRQTVAKLIGDAGRVDVAVDCYHDFAAQGGRARDDGRGSSKAVGSRWVAALCVALIVTAGGACSWWVLRRRRRKLGGDQVGRVASRPLAAGLDGVTSDGVQEDRHDAADPLAFLGGVSDDDLLWLLEGEQVQTIALVISRLSHDRAAAVLSGLDTRRQEQVIRHLVGLGQTAPETITTVADSLSERLRAPRVPSRDALTTVAEILNRAGGATERSVLDGLSQSQPRLASSIRRRMLAFEDIVHVPADRLCKALVSLEPHAVAVALRTAGDELRDRVLGSLPARQARSLRRQMDQIGPVRLSEVEAAQEHVAGAVRRFATAGAAEQAVR